MDQTATILLIGDEESLVERFDAVSDGYRVERVGDPGAAAEAAEGDVALVVLDGRPDDRAVEHLRGTLRELGYEGPVVGVTDSPDDPPADVDEYLVEPVDRADLRATVESLLPNGEATVFEALGDHKGRRCCRALLEEPRGARALADATGYSLPTVYRRLDALQSAGLVESSTRIRAGGGNYEVYRTVTTGLRVDIEDGFRVELQRELDEPDP